MPPEAAAAAGAAEAPHLLVVDDDPRLRTLLERFLKGEGFRVDTAGDAATAREKLSVLAFDLLVLDVGLPGESGLALAESLRRGERSLGVPILILDAVLAIPFALAVAAVRGSLTDRAIMVVTTVALSVSFLVYVIVGQWLFAFQLGWFPVQGWTASVWTNLTTYAPLPVLLAVMVGISPQMRLYRSFFLDEIGQDYVRTARAKGLSERAVLLRHVLRNALIPILTNVSMQLPGIFVGSFLIEVFFSIPGLGREVMLAVNRSDYPVIQAVTIYLAVITMVINLLTDLLYKAVDPRVTLK